MNIFDEIPWSKFKQLAEIKDLPLQNQIKRYNAYLDQLNVARFNNWYTHQPKGPASKRIENVGFLQQEDLYYILQEDGSKIYVTAEI